MLRSQVRALRAVGAAACSATSSAMPSRSIASFANSAHSATARPMQPCACRKGGVEQSCSSRAEGSKWSIARPSALQARRTIHTSPTALHGSLTRPEPGTGIKVTFRDSKGEDIKTVEVNEGDDLLSIAHEHDIDLEGACEGSIACSTCHVILEPDVYDKLEEPGDDENDMLDLAFGLTDTSRLGCQVKVTKDLDGMVAQLPAATRNMYVDGAKAGHGH